MDPLDAFMAEVHEEVKSQELQPKSVRLRNTSRCDEADDPVAEFMEVSDFSLGILESHSFCVRKARRERGLSSGMMAAMRTGTRMPCDSWKGWRLSGL